MSTYDVDQNGRVDSAELSKLPPPQAAALVEQSFSGPDTAPAGHAQPPILGPLSTAPLDRETAVNLLAALPPDKLAATMSVLDGWRITHQQEHRELAKELLHEVGPHRYADALTSIVGQYRSGATATPWLRALDRDGKREVIRELAAQAGSKPPSSPSGAQSMPAGLAELFQDHRVVVLGDDHSIEVESEKAIAKMMPMLAILGVESFKVEVSTTEQAALSTLSAGGKVRIVPPGQAAQALASGAEPPPGLLVQFMQENDLPRTRLFQAAYRAGIKVEAIDMPPALKARSPEHTRVRERLMTDEVAKSTAPTLVLAGAFHAIRNANGTDTPLASQLQARGIATASVKLESFTGIALRLEMGQSPSVAAGQESAYLKLVDSPAHHSKSFGFPTSKLGDLTFMNINPPNEDALGVPDNPLYREAYNQVFILSPSDS